MRRAPRDHTPEVQEPFALAGATILIHPGAGKVVERIMFLGQPFVRDEEFHGPGRLAGIDARDEIGSGRFTADAAACFVSFVRETLLPRLTAELADLAREARDLGSLARAEWYQASTLNVRFSIHMIENLVEKFERETRRLVVSAVLSSLVARPPVESPGLVCV